MSEAGPHLSARQSAQYAGVSEKTVRNWIAAGRISARKSADGWHIDQEQLEPLRKHSARTRRNGAEFPADLRADQVEPSALKSDAESAEVRGASAPQSAGIAALVALVDRLTRENRELAGVLGYRDAQLQQMQEQLKALQAPAESVVAERPPPPAEQSAPVARRPWWQFWKER